MGTRVGRILAVVGPGMLVAATGVGAGDLANAAFTGSKLGVAILWAVVVGAALKFVLNEGLTRWQLVTGRTLLEGVAEHFGRPVVGLFLLYFVGWSYFVGAALMSACGATFHAMVPCFADAGHGKIVYGLAHSAMGVVLVCRGGFKWFERVMSLCVCVMFAVVVVTAILLTNDWGSVGRGLTVPKIPDFAGAGRDWTLALLGGVGGSVTVLCYGYWIREKGRRGVEALSTCRLDLGVGYSMTALFGIAMVVIGSTVETGGRGAGLIVNLATSLEGPLGAPGKWIFLLGAWGAVTSSLLGVWQSVPYLFSDIVHALRGATNARPTATLEDPAYRIYLYAMATIPAVGLWTGFASTQKLYGVIGAAFMPMLAATLLILNRRGRHVGAHGNGLPTTVVMVVALLFFAGMFGSTIMDAMTG